MKKELDAARHRHAVPLSRPEAPACRCVERGAIERRCDPTSQLDTTDLAGGRNRRGDRDVAARTSCQCLQRIQGPILLEHDWRPYLRRPLSRRVGMRGRSNTENQHASYQRAMAEKQRPSANLNDHDTKQTTTSRAIPVENQR